MKWYLMPSSREYSGWKPRAIAKHLGNVSLPANEPRAKLSVGTHTLYPLDDDLPTLHSNQRIASRSISVGTDQATAAYTVEDKPVDEYRAERAIEAKALCRAKILEVVDETAQINLAAAAAADALTTEQRTVYKAGLAWIMSMRVAWRTLADDTNADLSDDANWPQPTQAMLDLANAF